MKHIKKKDVTWREFKKYFENKYLTKRYYEKKMKDFFVLKLESMSIEKFERRFLELLKYVSFIKDDTHNIQRHLSGFPPSISDKIQYDDPRKLEETIRRGKFLYDQQNQVQISKNLGKTRRNSRWIKGRRELRHHSSEVILGDSQLIENLK